MDEQTEFEVNKENLEELINKQKLSLNKDDIDLIKYFVYKTNEYLNLKENENKLFEAVQDIYGNVPVDKVYEVVINLLKSINNNKNITKKSINFYRKVNKVHVRNLDRKEEADKQLQSISNYISCCIQSGFEIDYVNVLDKINEIIDPNKRKGSDEYINLLDEKNTKKERDGVD